VELLVAEPLVLMEHLDQAMVEEVAEMPIAEMVELVAQARSLVAVEEAVVQRELELVVQVALADQAE
jgi:hypothetical protein